MRYKLLAGGMESFEFLLRKMYFMGYKSSNLFPRRLPTQVVIRDEHTDMIGGLVVEALGQQDSIMRHVLTRVRVTPLPLMTSFHPSNKAINVMAK